MYFLSKNKFIKYLIFRLGMVKTMWSTLPKKEPKEEKSFSDILSNRYRIKSADELAEKVRVLKHKNKIRHYEYEEDSFGVSVEPKYFWVIDFVRKMGFTVEKSWEKMGASVVSQFFSEMGSRRTILEKRGLEILGNVNTVIRSLINLLYDLREFDRRLEIYDKIHSENKDDAEAAEVTLKRVWMDEVDIKKGNGSINAMSAAKGLEFTTLRDAFMVAKKLADINSLDLNERVKRVLKGRLEEYLEWEKASEKELRMRRKVEKAYLVSQVNSLKLYSKWAKPYLQAAQRLQFEDVKLKDPDLIQAFDQNFIELNIRGTSKMRLKQFFAKGGTVSKVKPPETWSKKRKDEFEESKYGPAVFSVMDITFTYRTKPALVQQTQAGGVYRQIGRMNIVFDSYLFTKDEFELLDKQEEWDAMKFIEGMTDDSLEALREEIEKYLEEDKKEEKKEEKKKHEPILNKLFGSSAGSGMGFSLSLPEMFNKTKYTQAMAIARAAVADKAFNIYDIFKKAHGMLSFPYYPSYATPPASK